MSAAEAVGIVFIEYGTETLPSFVDEVWLSVVMSCGCSCVGGVGVTVVMLGAAVGVVRLKVGVDVLV